MFDDRLLERVAAAAGGRSDAMPGYLATLRDCMAKLSEAQRQMVRQRYEPGGSVEAVAAALGQSAGAVSASLYRIRKTLLACIRAELAKDRD